MTAMTAIGWAQARTARPDTDATAAQILVESAAGIEHLGLDVDATLAWAAAVGERMPLPGAASAAGATVEFWEALASAAALDVGAARILEPHLDARAILAQARGSSIDLSAPLARIGVTGDSTWGVFAAEGPGQRLAASAGPDERLWRLTGTKPWCSLAEHLSHALVTAWTGPDTRRLFAVALRSPGVHPRSGPWVSRGLAQVTSAPVDFADVEAVPIGADGWYLMRPGFAWGAMGVAAAWWGGALPLRDALVRAASVPHADQVAALCAGEADAALWAARTSLDAAAAAVDDGVSGADATMLAARVRAVVADAVERVLALSGRALGPGPLATDEDHARRVADLRIYLRQHHGERDLARLGAMVARP